MKVNFVPKLTEKKEILALVTDKKSILDFKELDKNTLNKIQHAINNEDFNFNKFSSLEIINDKNTSFSKIILISPNGVATSISIGLFSSLSKNSQILPGSLIYVPQFIGKIDGISLASAVAPIVSSFALSIASLNSINN